MLTAAAYNLIHDAYQLGDTSGLVAFLKQAKSGRTKEIGRHVANLARLKALYDRTHDGEADVICDELADEEDWLGTQLGFDA